MKNRMRSESPGGIEGRLAGISSFLVQRWPREGKRLLSKSHSWDLRPSQLTLNVIKFSELLEANDADKLIFSFPQPQLQNVERSVLPGERTTRASWGLPRADLLLSQPGPGGGKG